MIIYDKRDGKTWGCIPNDVDMLMCLFHYPQDLKDNLESINVINPPNDWINYRVIFGELIRIPRNELMEISYYGKILTDEERILESLKPKYSEIEKAKRTLEYLDLMEEVM